MKKLYIYYQQGAIVHIPRYVQVEQVDSAIQG